MAAISVGSSCTEPLLKRARAHGGNPDTGRVGAAEHDEVGAAEDDESITVAIASVEEQQDADMDAKGPRAELFDHGVARDHALIEWLRARQTQARCGILLQQICEWKTRTAEPCEIWPTRKE